MIQVIEKEQRLRNIVRDYGRVLVAFSGGVDSALLLKVAALELGDNCYALTCVSPTMASREIAASRQIGEDFGLGDRHYMIRSHELERPGFAQNPKNRCALCKIELMSIAEPLAKKLKIAHILLGTNMDDLGDFRPGIEAAKKRGADSPMVEAEMHKTEIRQLSRKLGLPTWNKPQMACLSSRFPYGTTITPERLARVDQFENELKDLGFRQLRVRFHDTVARIEIAKEELERAFQDEMRAKIVAIGVKIGFTYVTIDLAGFRSGSLNETPLIELRPKSRRAS